MDRMLPSEGSDAGSIPAERIINEVNNPRESCWEHDMQESKPV